MVTLPASIDSFFFRRIGAAGFSAMRIAWAFITGAFLLMQWKDVSYYYSNQGILTPELSSEYTRGVWRFSLFDYVQDPLSVFCIYLILLLALFCMMVGLWPRLSTIASVALLFSFHEFNPMILGGGDTLLRNIGFLLMIAPGIDSLSIARSQAQWLHWKKNRSLLAAATMPIWPWRMLLWQMMVLYGTSLWYKLLGTMWLNGTAVEATFHHPVFVRWPGSFMNSLMPIVGAADFATLFWQGAWLLLLIPRWLTDLLPPLLPRIPLRRILLIGGLFFHGGILLFMDAGIFSLAIWTAYLGLLRDDDFAWMKRTMSGITNHQSPITVLYDGHCGLCLRSLFILQILDWFDRLNYANFRIESERKTYAPEITEETLDKAMHIKLKDDRYLTGFDAFRRMAWSLPTLWIFAPFLYIPGIPFIGRRMYAKIAANRKKCDHESCRLSIGQKG